MILSICIPTYNRAAILDRSLSRLVPQCENRPVEICVSNNASTDDTAAVLDRYPTVRAIHQSSNTGIDRNTVAALEMGSGLYLAPFGDDEHLSTVGIGLIVAALRSSPDMLLFNGRRAGVEHLPRRLQGRSFTGHREAFAALWDKMPLGSFAVRREAYERARASRYLGTFHAYSGAAWDYLGSLARFRIDCMSSPVVDFQDVPKSWSRDRDVIHEECIPRWFDLLPAAFGDAAERSRLRYLATWGAPRSFSALEGLDGFA